MWLQENFKFHIWFTYVARTLFLLDSAELGAGRRMSKSGTVIFDFLILDKRLKFCVLPFLAG